MIFNLQSLAVVVLLATCSATYLRPRFPSFIDAKRAGFPGLFGRFSVVGERLSGVISVFCLLTAFSTLFLR